MADNVTAPATGEIFATDDIGGLQYPRTKVGFGIDGAYVDVSATAPLPVLEIATVITGQAAQTAVINNILPATAGAAGTDVANLRSASVQVVSTGTAGTFIFEQSNDNVNWVALPVFNAALVTGVPITAAITATASAIIYTFPLRCQFLRLRIATTITGGSIQAFSRISSEPWTAAAQLVANNTGANLAVSGSVTATGVVGPAAHDAAISGNPLRLAGRALTANYTAVANGDVADMITTLVGAQVSKPYAIPEAGWNANVSLTTATAAAIIGAAGAGLKRHITALQAINTGASAVDLIILDGATERWRLPLPINIPVSITFPTELITTAATALNGNLSAVGTVRVNAQGYTAP